MAFTKGRVDRESGLLRSHVEGCVSLSETLVLMPSRSIDISSSWFAATVDHPTPVFSAMRSDNIWDKLRGVVRSPQRRLRPPLRIRTTSRDPVWSASGWASRCSIDKRTHWGGTCHQEWMVRGSSQGLDCRVYPSWFSRPDLNDQPLRYLLDHESMPRRRSIPVKGRCS